MRFCLFCFSLERAKKDDENRLRAEEDRKFREQLDAETRKTIESLREEEKKRRNEARMRAEDAARDADQRIREIEEVSHS